MLMTNLEKIKDDREALLERVRRLEGLRTGPRLLAITGLIMVIVAYAGDGFIKLALFTFALELILLVTYERVIPKTIIRCREYISELEAKSPLGETKKTA